MPNLSSRPLRAPLRNQKKSECAGDKVNEEGRLTKAFFSPTADQPEECGEVESPGENGNDEDDTFLYILISEFWLHLTT